MRRGDRSRTHPSVVIHCICIILTTETPTVPFDRHLRWTFVLDPLPYLEYLKAEQRERSGSWCQAKSEERLHKLFKLKRQEGFQANGRFTKAPPPEWLLATPTLATIAFSGS